MRARFCQSVPYFAQTLAKSYRNKMQCAAACGTRPLWHLRFISWCENNSTRRRAVRNLKRSHKNMKFHKRIIWTLSISSYEISATVSPKPIFVLPCCLRSSVYEHLLSFQRLVGEKSFNFLYDRQLFSSVMVDVVLDPYSWRTPISSPGFCDQKLSYDTSRTQLLRIFYLDWSATTIWLKKSEFLPSK